MEKIYIVLIEDHHADVDVKAFRDENSAIAWAWKEAGRGAAQQELNEHMQRDGWVLFLQFGPEDYITVLRRELQ